MGLWSKFKSWFFTPRPPETPSTSKPGGRPKASLVLLCNRPAELSASLLREVVQKQLDITLPDRSDESPDFVTGAEPFYFLQFRGRLFHVMNMTAPYFDDPGDVAADIRELRLARAVAEHRAWTAIDLMFEYADAPAENPYALMGKILAPLAFARAAALYWPGGPSFWLYDQRVARVLQSDDPLAGLRESVPSRVPVVNVPDDDPRMLRAVAEARKRWPEFVAAFEAREPGESFSVKARFSDGAHAEFMWMKVTAIEANIIYGMLDNEPVNLKRFRPGQRLRVPASDLCDWLFTQSEELHGAFTIKVIQQIQREQDEE